MKHLGSCSTMKKKSVYYLLLLMCWTVVAAESENQPKGVSRDKHRQFADQLVENLYTNDNECSSTWGISLLFDLLRPGASTKTETELCNVMGLCTKQQQEQSKLRVNNADESQDALLWKDTVDEITTMYDGSCTYEGYDGEQDACEQNRPLVAIANSVWVDKESNVDPNYLLAVDEYLQRIEFRDQNASQAVNDWVKNSTLGLIDSIFEPGPIDANLCAVNSIYFNAGWRKFFHEPFTNEDLFYTDYSRKTPLSNKAHFMHKVGKDYNKYPYSATALPGYQILELAYQQPAGLSMFLVLPMKEEAPMVSSADVTSVKQTLEPTAVAMAIPKFQYESSYKTTLQEALVETGLETPFSLGTDEGFCGMITNQCLFVNVIIQKTSIHVNEKGTVAAAVSAAILRGAAPPQPEPDPVLFQADHPFQFFICDSNTDVCLFEGRVGAPTIPSGSQALLQSVHSEADFWSTNFGTNVRAEQGFSDPSAGPYLAGIFLPSVMAILVAWITWNSI